MNGDLRGSFNARVKRDPQYRYWVLLRLYESQTPNEQAHHTTRDLNHLGFSAPDAPILSLLAEKLLRGESLSQTDEFALKTCLPRYWSQFPTLSEPPLL